MAAFSGMGRDDQRATAGRLMSGSSLIRLMVSSVMYLTRWTAHLMAWTAPFPSAKMAAVF
ncbi:hypothetical protein [Sinorhizobium prairiense]|uniref:hypothetical protein n=1 Tax=unclassified Sinorhizobium TaxID=2613772 RepID=UPI0023D85CAA|nr:MULTISPECIES: hypothetical protein [unclassified Sinorhizobium]WEJ08574.1 hypothetical protein N0Q90_02720 [Sinorhizobium sp. M103]WEJ13922.1 hypothetical protein N0Q91_02685 [Sinorhizobium sp. K101]WEJ35524.1 hypothetical protein N0R80_02725 [Sinorhizobium sp. C101]